MEGVAKRPRGTWKVPEMRDQGGPVPWDTRKQASQQPWWPSYVRETEVQTGRRWALQPIRQSGAISWPQEPPSRAPSQNQKTRPGRCPPPPCPSRALPGGTCTVSASVWFPHLSPRPETGGPSLWQGRSRPERPRMPTAQMRTPRLREDPNSSWGQEVATTYPGGRRHHRC